MGENSLIKAFREDRDKRNERTRKWHRGNPARSYVLAAKGRAHRTGLPFNLEPEDIIFPDKCPILGIPITLKGEGNRNNNTASLDRIVPSKGYVKDNVQIISWRANRLKTDASLEELESIVNYMKKMLDKQP